MDPKAENAKEWAGTAFTLTTVAMVMNVWSQSYTSKDLGGPIVGSAGVVILFTGIAYVLGYVSGGESRSSSSKELNDPVRGRGDSLGAPSANKKISSSFADTRGVDTRARLAEDLKAAKKAGNKPVVDALQVIIGTVNSQEIYARRNGIDFTEDEVQAVLQTMMKNYQRVADMYENMRRFDMADKEKQGIRVISNYL
jgi:Yqey-like protein